MSWSVRRQILMGASWRWVPGVDGFAGDGVTEYLNEAFGFEGYQGRMCESWDATLGRAVEYLPIGYRYGEPIWKMADGMVWIDRIADRMPQSHDRWLMDDDGRTLAGVLQRHIVGQPSPEPIPASKLFLLTRNRQGSDFGGEGLMRPAERWIALAAHALDSMGVATERWAIPFPRIRVDYEAAAAQGYAEGQLEQEIADKAAEAEALVGHEESFVVDTPAIAWETYGGDLDPSAVIAVLDECDAQIAKAFGTQFLRLGVSDTGARNVGEVHRDVLTAACVNDLDYIRGEVERQLAAPLLMWNFGLGPGDPRAPRLEHSGVEVNKLADVIAYIPALTAAGHLPPMPAVTKAIGRLGGFGLSDEDADRAGETVAPAYPNNGRPSLPDPGEVAPASPPMEGGE